MRPAGTRARRLAATGCALTLALAPCSYAQSRDEIQALRAQQQRINEQLQQLQQENQRLQERLDALTKNGQAPERPGKQTLTQNRKPPEEQNKHALQEQPTPEQAVAKTALPPNVAPEKPPVDVGYNDGGGGFYLRTDDAQLRLLGYIQTLGALYDGRLDRPKGKSEFDIRRARLDFIADFNEKFQAFVEIDGGPGSTPGGSDFGLIVAQGNWKVFDDDVQLTFGKIITPFNNEDTTSSRSIDTVERGLAVNSLFLLPAIDAQFGAEVHGELGARNQWVYRLGVYNGNGNANDNRDENNSSKEVQARLNYVWSPTLTTGVALDFDNEEEQVLTLADLGFSSYVSVPIKGSRRGIDADFEWRPKPFHLTGEVLALRFEGDDNPRPIPAGGVALIPQNGHINFYGGYIQPSYFISGDHSEGVELLFRAEGVTMDGNTGGDGDTLYAGTLGSNWFISPNTRLQVNAIGQYFNGPSAIRGFDHGTFVPLLLTEMQFKF